MSKEGVSFKNRDRFIQLGIAISTLRKLRGMSQDQLAEKANMSRSHLSAIEAPNMIRSFSLETLFNLADALMITPSDLLNTSLFSEQINELIPNECADLLRVHFKQAGLFYGDKNRHVFSSQRNEHMTISCVEEVVSKYVNMAKKLHPGLFQQKAYTPHAFRHTIAVDMLACGCSLPAIKAFLGHSSIQSTMIYATVTSDQANKILRERGLPAKLPAPEKEKGDEKTDVIWFLRE